MRGLCFGGVREYDRLESSRARIIPRVVTMMAAVFCDGGYSYWEGFL